LPKKSRGKLKNGHEAGFAKFGVSIGPFIDEVLKLTQASIVK
jgi:hypothetical protein